FSSRRRHTRSYGDWSSDVCSSDLYLRPTNGRAEDQERRNHTTQYISYPDWSWSRLRQETPPQYESYVHLEADRWTTIRIEVRGEIGRASCRERAEVGEGEGVVERT